jgi:hypothetical protein
MSTTFDTLKFVESLEAGGFTHQQAKAAAQAFAGAQSEGDLVTKADLKIAISDLRADIIKWVIGLALAQMGLTIGVLMKLSAGH